MSAAAIFQLTTPFLESELSAIRFEQSLDGIVLTHLNHPVQRLRRFDHNDWRIDDAPIGVSGPAPAAVGTVVTNPNNSEADDGYVETPHQYAVSAVDASTARESPVTDGPVVNNDVSVKGNINTITWGAVTNAAEYRVYRKKNGNYGYVGTVEDGLSFVDDNIQANFADGPPRSFNPFADDQNPACVTFHDRRTFYGRTLKRPSAVFGSQSEDLFNHDKSRPLRATDSIAVNLIARRLNTVRHLMSLGNLLAFTSDGIFSLRPTTAGGLTPLGLETKAEGFQGVGNARPEAIDTIGFYTTARGNALRSINYTFERDGFKGNDITVFAPHFFSSYSIVAMAWCEEPSHVLWVLRNDGKLLALTWQAEQDVWGWTLCETDGVVESICSVSEEGRDVLYAVVQRTIGEEQVRYVERLTNPHWIDENWTAQEDAVVMDCSTTYRGDPVKALTGLTWLEGMEVAVLADGYVRTGHSVVNGRLTPDLPDASSTISVGLPYVSYLRTLPVVATTGSGSTQGRKQTVSNVIIRVLNTSGIRAGTGLDPVLEQMHDAPIPPQQGTISPPPLYSGDLDTMGMDADDWRSAKVTIAQLQPLPMVITGVAPDLEFGR